MTIFQRARPRGDEIRRHQQPKFRCDACPDNPIYTPTAFANLSAPMSFRWCNIAALAAFAALPARAATPAAEVKKSAVRIAVTMQEPNYRVPWTPGQVGGGV